MATVKYSLDDFINDMEELVQGAPNKANLFEKGSSYLERLMSNPAAIPAEYQVPKGGDGARANHGSYLLHRGDSGLLVTAVVWGPGDHADPHDHHTWGIIGVMNNALTETRFRRLDDRSNSEYAKLEQDRIGNFKPGEITLLIPDEDEIHQMDNLTDRPTSEIHVYGRELTGLNRCRFDAESGKISTFMTKGYDNE